MKDNTISTASTPSVKNGGEGLHSQEDKVDRTYDEYDDEYDNEYETERIIKNSRYNKNLSKTPKRKYKVDW